MSRARLFGIWLMCAVVSPVLFAVMLMQVFLGNTQRVMSVFVAYDECGNDALGGQAGLTVSAQVGNALKRGRKWAIPAAAVIDALMGKGHCLANATISG